MSTQSIDHLQEQIAKKDLAIKALVMWITSDLSNALDDSFSVSELKEIHATTYHPVMQDKPIDEIIRSGLYDE